MERGKANGSKLAAFEATIHQNDAMGGCQDKSFIGTLLSSNGGGKNTPFKKLKPKIAIPVV